MPRLPHGLLPGAIRRPAGRRMAGALATDDVATRRRENLETAPGVF